MSLIKPTIACHECGNPIDGTRGLTMCLECIRLTSNVGENVVREGTVQFCRNCERFLVPPQSWVNAAPESRELLSLLLKRLQGLNKLRLVDASFIWTEPHSKRIKIKVTVQGEAQGGAIIQETFPVEFVVVGAQCPDCAKSFTVHTWRASLQLRQKVPHKRTFFYLEQLILKHNAHLDTVSIKESRDGIDFFFAQPNHAIKMLDFLSTVAPIRSKRSQQLISTDTHTGSSQYKFTHSVEIAPICREDLVILPRTVARKLSNINRVVLCKRITNSIHFLDPTTLESADIFAKIYWRAPFGALMTYKDFIEFIVLECEPLGPMQGRHVLADVTVARADHMDQSYSVRSHLGAILKPGDSVAGYYLVDRNFNSDELDSLPQGSCPDVILVRKIYPSRRKTPKRNWRLKRMAKEHQDLDAAQIDRAEADLEAFLHDLEQDKEYRGTVNLYKAPKSQEQNIEDNDEDEDEDDLTIDVSELLEDMGDLNIS